MWGVWWMGSCVKLWRTFSQDCNLSYYRCSDWTGFLSLWNYLGGVGSSSLGSEFRWLQFMTLVIITVWFNKARKDSKCNDCF